MNLCYGCCQPMPSETQVCPTCGDKEFQNHCMFLQTGTVLNGKFLVGRVLGHGGFGVTYLAYDANLETQVAIKEYLPNELASRDQNTLAVHPFNEQTQEVFEEYLEKFLSESRILAKFRHPAVVSIKSYFRENGTGYMVMDYLEGMDLEELRTKEGGTLHEEVVLPLMKELLEGLAYIHGKQLLHRDIKPANLFLTNAGQLTLLDFGSAREHSGGNAPLTQLWTPGFSPPEQSGNDNSKQGPWTDLYSVAAAACTLLTGTTPPSLPERMMGIPLFPENSGLSNGTRRWLTKALELKTTDRYQSATEMLRALDTPPPERIAATELVLVSAASESKRKARSGKARGSQENLNGLSAPESQKRPLLVPLVVVGMLLLLGSLAGVLFLLKPSGKSSTRAASSSGSSALSPAQGRQARAVAKVRRVPARPAASPLTHQWSSPATLSLRLAKAIQAYHAGDCGALNQLRGDDIQLASASVPGWMVTLFRGLGAFCARRRSSSKALLAAAMQEYKSWKKLLHANSNLVPYYWTWMYQEYASRLAYGIATRESYPGTKAQYLLLAWYDFQNGSFAPRAEKSWWQLFLKQRKRLSFSHLFKAGFLYDSIYYTRITRAKTVLSFVLRSIEAYSTSGNGLVYTKAARRLALIYLRAGEFRAVLSLYRRWRARSGASQRAWYKLRLKIYDTVARCALSSSCDSSRFLSQFDSNRDRQVYLFVLAKTWRRKAKFRKAITVYNHLLRDFVQGKPYKRYSYQWYKGLLLAAIGKHREAMGLFRSFLTNSQAKNDWPRNAWIASVFAMKAGKRALATRIRKRLCRYYPLTPSGMNACSILGTRVTLQRPIEGRIPAALRTEATKLARQNPLASALFLLGHLDKLDNPSDSLPFVLKTARAWSNLLKGERGVNLPFPKKLAYEILLFCADDGLKTGKLPSNYLREMFPKMGYLSSLSNNATHRWTRDVLFLHALANKVSHFYQNHGRQRYVGLFGLPSSAPGADSEDATKQRKALEQHLTSIQIGTNRWLSLSGFQHYSATIRSMKAKMPGLSSSLLCDIEGDLWWSRDFVLKPKAGLLWHYQMYHLLEKGSFANTQF